ncbi:Heparan-alpha-glucosaminide N-acetyltransferase [Linum perenne]
MALSTTGYGQIPFDEEMQKPSYRPPSSFDDCIGDSAQLLRSFKKTKRLASLDAFRGLCVFLMMVVDYGGSVFPIIAHSPWNGLHLADFVMPFFLFVVGVSIALVYKKAPNKTEATWKAAGRAVKLFLLGILLQGGFLHGLNSLTYGVDMEKIRLLGILQRISIGYFVGAVCEIWLSRRTRREIGVLKSYYWHWVAAFALIAVYLGLLYGVYVPDWQFVNDGNIYTETQVNCSVRGNVGPACNSAGMIDRYVLGINHLYAKPVYKNLKECKMSRDKSVPDDAPSWCHAPFDPEGLISSITAAVTCLIGLQFGHVLAHLQDHKGRLENWCGFSVFLLVLGLFLALIGFPINKPLYSISYMLITSATAGITFCALYLLVDIYGYRWATLPLEWMGKHALSIFIIVSSNLAVIAIQGFYWKSPENNLMNCIVSLFVHR